ncbi:DUF3302 domain-containing protein [uncultured Shimia sp.]|uniref:DUF3302 domain-containing protein n=1 Tax=uncultured Shimia sp. TaxID=573152 RepID=UPI003429AD6F
MASRKQRRLYDRLGLCRIGAIGVYGRVGRRLVGVCWRLARTARDHPYRTAVTIGGWVTLIGGGVFFPLVLIWAYAGTPDAALQSVAREDIA